MTDQQIADALASHHFLQGMPRSLVDILASGAKVRNLQSGEILGAQGQPAAAFYLILSGHIALQTRELDPKGLPIQTLNPGEPLGWSWLIPPHRWQFDCRTLDCVQCLVFDGAWLRQQCEANHELGYELLKRLVATLASRLSVTRMAGFLHQIHHDHR